MGHQRTTTKWIAPPRSSITPPVMKKPWNHPTSACHREWFAGASLALLRVRMLNGGTDENCHCPRDDVLLLQNEAQAAEHSDDEKRTNPKQKFAFHWCPAHAARQ